MMRRHRFRLEERLILCFAPEWNSTQLFSTMGTQQPLSQLIRMGAADTKSNADTPDILNRLEHSPEGVGRRYDEKTLLNRGGRIGAISILRQDTTPFPKDNTLTSKQTLLDDNVFALTAQSVDTTRPRLPGLSCAHTPTYKHT